MYENFAWEQFLITGNLETFIEYRKIMQLNENNIYEKKDGVINEAYKGKGDSNSRSSI